MSKSDPSDASRINLTDNKDQIINKIKKAKTDNLTMPTSKVELRNRPEINNLVEIYSSFTDENLDKSLDNLNGKSFSDLKNLISEILVEQIEPIGKKINELLKDKDYLDKILLEGSTKANNIADKKVKDLKKIIGLK